MPACWNCSPRRGRGRLSGLRFRPAERDCVRRGNWHGGADHAPACERMVRPHWGFFGLRWGAGWAGGSDRWGGAPLLHGPGNGWGREGWWFRRGRDVRGCGGGRGVALLVCGEVGGPARISASSTRRRCRPWVKRARMSAVSVVPKARMRPVRSVVSVRHRTQYVPHRAEYPHVPLARPRDARLPPRPPSRP